MAEPGSRPPSVAASARSPVPANRRLSVNSRASRSSLIRDRQEIPPAGQAESPQPTPDAELVESTEAAEATEPAFSPLFTILTSTQHPMQRVTTHHPVMHYIFLDDDPELLTEALNHHHNPPPESASDHEPGSPPERALLLDVVPDEDGNLQVGWASSLSPDWAVVDAHISPMETGNGGPAAVVSSTSETLMLHVEGVTISPAVTTSAGKSPVPEAETHSSGESIKKPTDENEYAALIDDFDKRMQVLKRVVAAAETRPLNSNTEPEAEPEPELEPEEPPLSPASVVAGAEEGTGSVERIDR